MTHIADDRINTAAEMITPGVTSRPAQIITAPAAAWPDVEPDWRGLVAQTPDQSVFVGADWIGSWIKNYQKKLSIEIVRIYESGKLVAVCLLTKRLEWKGPVPVRRVYLNAAGEDEWEEVGAEFNHFVCLPGREVPASNLLRRHMDEVGWDEFVLPGCVRTDTLQAIKRAFAEHQVESRIVRSYYVDLADLRTTGKRFELSLSSNFRTQIRQSVRKYEEAGPIRLEHAPTLARARELMSELRAIHTERWRAKGRAGAFASPRFQQFHLDLLEKCFDRGQIDLVRVSTGESTIGVLYNIVAQGKVFFYQSGFRISEDNRLRPGYVTFHMALESYRQTELNEFDFMAGSLDYKRRFSQKFRELEWCSIRRRGWRMSLIDSLRFYRNLCREPVQQRKMPIASSHN
jgi:CelD/BcsL family acetyltransferase involved in cellulose biosynthesis